MTTPRRFRSRSLWRAAVALLFSAAPFCASAQIIQGLHAGPVISAYATLPINLTPDFRESGTPAVAGYSLGGFLQTPFLIGVEVRGQIQRRLNAQHQESALAGPRIALRYGRLAPYVSVLGGAGNGWRFREPPIPGVKPPKPIEGLGGQWTILGGLDVKLTHHIAVRVGEVSYSKIYLKDWNLTPLNLTAGIVYRIN
jgi:hypothetical protein